MDKLIFMSPSTKPTMPFELFTPIGIMVWQPYADAHYPSKVNKRLQAAHIKWSTVPWKCEPKPTQCVCLRVWLYVYQCDSGRRLFSTANVDHLVATVHLLTDDNCKYEMAMLPRRENRYHMAAKMSLCIAATSQVSHPRLLFSSLLLCRGRFFTTISFAMIVPK